MLTWIKNFLTPPVFAGERVKMQQARLVTQIVISLLLCAALTLAGRRLGLALVLASLGFVTMILLRRGQLRFASILIIIGLTVTFTGLVLVLQGGIRTPFYSIYLVLIFIAIILLGRDWGIGLTIFSVSLGVLLALYELVVGELVPVFVYPPLVALVVNIVVIGVTVALFYVTLGNMNQALFETKLTNQRLGALRANLEARVAERTQDLSRRTRYLEATADVARYISSELELGELLSRLATLISERFDFYHAGIFLLDTTGEWAELQAASSAGGQQMLAREHRLRVGQTGTVGYVTAHGVARIALDVGADAVFFDNPDLPNTRSAMTLPLRSRNRIIGALDVQSTESAAFTAEDVTVLQALADQVALAISNARLFERLQDSVAAERRAYGELSYRAWAEMLHARGEIGYVDDEAGTRPVRADRVSPGEVETDVLAADGGATEVAGTIHSAENTLVIPVRSRESGADAGGGPEAEGVLGVVRLRKPKDVGGWTPEQIVMMESITEQMGVALERARLYQDSRRLAMRERLVSEATNRMRQTLEVESVLKIAADEVYRALGLEEVTVRLQTGVQMANINARAAADQSPEEDYG